MEHTSEKSHKHFKDSLNQVIASFTKNNLSLDTLSASGVRELVTKVTEDINFLEDRISHVKNAQNSNSIVLQTYENMLESRKEVLKWLEEKLPTEQLSSLKTG